MRNRTKISITLISENVLPEHDYGMVTLVQAVQRFERNIELWLLKSMNAIPGMALMSWGQVGVSRGSYALSSY